MTVIDYVPVGGEVKPNILLGETKKCIISKVTACITPLSLYIDLDKQQYTRAVRQPVACRFKGIMFAQVLCVDGMVCCVQVCLSHAILHSSTIFMFRPPVTMATAWGRTS